MSSILRLPDSATRLISSHIVVVTPVSLVKELLENSIDAKATSVEILISSDTISKIEIRDDGIGIHPDDYDALGRRGHTSKLRTIDELGDVVGKTLGFRGEALASVNSLADVTITTKTSTEPVAATLQLVRDEGGVLQQRSASAPAGTTVKVARLFGRQPVREQVAIKEAKRTIERIQELLRSYAMARPQLKLVFKVLQSSTKLWSYSPKPNATVTEAVLQLFGVAVTSSCSFKTIQSNRLSLDGASSTNQGYLLEAFLANPEAELQNVPKRHYLSVDGRPINVGRGIAKKLLKIYTEHLKSSVTKNKDITDSFIRLNICCPSKSYDANIEPSKDDVLFSDENVILDTFRQLCDEIYKPSATNDDSHVGTMDAKKNSASVMEFLNQDHQKDIPTPPSSLDCPPMFNRDTNTTLPEVSVCNNTHSVDQLVTTGEPWRDQGSRELQPSIRFTPINTGSRPREAQELLSPQESVVRDRGHDSDGRINPWVIAKMSHSDEPSPPTADVVLPRSPRSPLMSEPPILRHAMAPPGDLDVPRTQHNTRRARLPCVQQCTVPGGSFRSPMPRPSDGQPKRSSLPRSNISLHRHHHGQPPWTPPSSVERTQYRDAFQVDTNPSTNPDGFKQTQISFNRKQANRPQVESHDGEEPIRIGFKRPRNNLEVDADLNMEHAFTTARQNLQYQLSNLKDNEPTITAQDNQRGQHEEPVRRRQPARAMQAQSSENHAIPKEVRAPLSTTLPADDPRAYLLRRQKSIAAEESGAKPKRLRRLKSCLLPLETIPFEYQCHSLALNVSIDSQFLDGLVQGVRKHDEYVIKGTLVDGMDMSLDEGRKIESRLRKLVADQRGNEGADENDATIIDLQAALKGKGIICN